MKLFPFPRKPKEVTIIESDKSRARKDQDDKVRSRSPSYQDSYRLHLRKLGKTKRSQPKIDEIFYLAGNHIRRIKR